MDKLELQTCDYCQQWYSCEFGCRGCTCDDWELADYIKIGE